MLIAGLGGSIGLEQLAKLINRKTGVANDTAEGKRVDGIVTRNSKDARAVGHDDMFALTDDDECPLLESTHGIKMVDAGNLGQDYTATSTSRICSPRS